MVWIVRLLNEWKFIRAKLLASADELSKLSRERDERETIIFFSSVSGYTFINPVSVPAAQT